MPCGGSTDLVGPAVVEDVLVQGGRQHPTRYTHHSVNDQKAPLLGHAAAVNVCVECSGPVQVVVQLVRLVVHLIMRR